MTYPNSDPYSIYQNVVIEANIRRKVRYQNSTSDTQKSQTPNKNDLQRTIYTRVGMEFHRDLKKPEFYKIGVGYTNRSIIINEKYHEYLMKAKVIP